MGFAMLLGCASPTTDANAVPTEFAAIDPAREPAWYRAVPNRPGVAVFGSGGATVPGAGREFEAEHLARQMAVAQLKGRLRSLFSRAFSRLPRGTISVTDIPDLFDRCLDNTADTWAALIRTVDSQTIARGENLRTVYVLVAADIHAIIKRIADRQGEWQMAYAVAGHGQPPPPLFRVPIEQIHAGVRYEQESAWGVRACEAVAVESATDFAPAWLQSLPNEPGEAFFGVGAARGEGALAALRVQEQADRTARHHLRDLVRLTVEMSLPEYLGDVLAVPLPTNTGRALVLRVAEAVAALVATEALIADSRLNLGPTDPVRISAYALSRATVADVARHLAVELSSELAGLSADLGQPLTQPNDGRLSAPALSDFLRGAQTTLWQSRDSHLAAK